MCDIVIVQESTALYDAAISLLRQEYKFGQTRPGLHLSALTSCLTKHYWDEHDPLPPSDEQAQLWAIGWAMERVMISRSHMEPVEVDGITATPDFSLLGVPGDLKTTRMAENTSAGCAVCGQPYTGHTKAATGHAYEKAPPLPFQIPLEWQRRFMGYRYMLNRELTKSIKWDKHIPEPRIWRTNMTAGGRFAVLVYHLIPAKLHAYDIRFSQKELEDNWQWILARKAAYDKMDAAEDPQPFQHNESYECNGCAYLLTCQLWASLHPVEEN